MRHRYSAFLALNDLLFNTLLGFAALLILIILYMNPITKTGDIPSKAEIMITLEWDHHVGDDIDIWMIGPGMDRPLSFQNKEAGFMHLDRDDLGLSTDLIIVDGERKYIRLNREIVTMRGINAGDYFINIHVYSKKDNNPVTVTVSLADVNPYKEVYHIQETVTKRGEILRMPAFTVDKDGKITDVFTSDAIFVSKKQSATVPGRNP